MSNAYGKKLLFLRPEKIMLPLFPIKLGFDEHSLKPLADSISAIGIIEPLIVRKNNLAKFELISGYRRLKAAMTVGLRRVPCILVNSDDFSAALISVSENLAVVSPNYFEQAEMFKKISVRFGMDYETLAEKCGLSHSALLNRIKLLSLSDAVRQKLITSGLDEKFALLVSMLAEDRQLEFINEIVSMSLTLDKAKEATQKYILRPAQIKTIPPCEPIPARKTAVCDVRIFSNSLSKLLNTLKASGIAAYSDTVEKESYIEYTIKIPKPKQSVPEKAGII